MKFKPFLISFLVSILLLAALALAKTYEIELPGRAALPSSVVRVEARNMVEREVTKYSSVESCFYPVKDKCLVASGKIAEVGMIAMNNVPFGTKVEIQGKTYTVEDRIAKRFGDRIDIFSGYGEEAHRSALEWGIRSLIISYGVPKDVQKK